jgi:hypothetical protein
MTAPRALHHCGSEKKTIDCSTTASRKSGKQQP